MVVLQPAGTRQLIQGFTWVVSFDFQGIRKSDIHRQLSNQAPSSSFIPLAKILLNLIYSRTEEFFVSIRI